MHTCGSLPLSLPTYDLHISTWQPLAQFTHGDVLLFEADLMVLVLLIGGLQSLPRQLSAEKIEQHVRQTLQVVPTRTKTSQRHRYRQ